MIEVDAIDDMSCLPMDEEIRKKVDAWFKSFLKDIEPPSKILIFGTKWRPNDMWDFMKVQSSNRSTKK